MNFDLMQFHGYSLTELENMLPWERIIYISFLQNHIAEENKRIAERNNKAKSGGRTYTGPE